VDKLQNCVYLAENPMPHPLLAEIFLWLSSAEFNYVVGDD
jgi:hypothetical protein